MDLTSKKDNEIEIWIKNHGQKGATNVPLYIELLEERARRSQDKQMLNFDKSLQHLKQVAVNQTCTSYGALAAASGVPWSQARYQMNGAGGHLDRLLDICYARKLPLLTAICVNQGNLVSGELEDAALSGCVAGAKRLGIHVSDELTFHQECRDKCWQWGRQLIKA